MARPFSDEMNESNPSGTRGPAGPTLGFALACVALLSACGGEPDVPEADHHMAGAVPAAPSQQPDGRVFESLQDFVEGYWVRPIPPQGDPPSAWSDLEASLRPEDCATCHPAQYEAWRTTVHSAAYSPGLSGQLVNWEEAAFGTVQSCLVCHAPLSEQSSRLPSGDQWIANPAYDAGLRNHGIACAACHVRGNRRHGPPTTGRIRGRVTRGVSARRGGSH